MVMKFGECGHPLRSPDLHPPEAGMYTAPWCEVCGLLAMSSADVRDDADATHETQPVITAALRALDADTWGGANVDSTNAYDFPVIDEDFGGATTHPDAFHVTCLADAMIIENILRFRARHAVDLDTTDAWLRRRSVVEAQVFAGNMHLDPATIRAVWVRVPWQWLDRSYIPPEVVEASPNRVRVNVEPFTGIHAGVDYERGVPVAIVQQRMNEAMKKHNITVDGIEHTVHEWWPEPKP